MAQPSPSPPPRRFRSRIAALLFGLASTGLGLTGVARAQLALPLEDTGVTISATSDLVYTIDLATIPNRPEIHVEVTPSDARIVLEIEANGWTGLGPCVGDGMQVWSGSFRTFVSTPALGSNSLVVPLRSCEPRVPTGFWDNGTVDIAIRIVGGNSTQTTADVSIRGVTIIPTGELTEAVDTSPGPQSITLSSSRDTVIYQANPTASDGNGEFLWAGHDYRLIGIPPHFIPIRFRLNSLMAFDDLLADVPPGSVVTNASLDLVATGVLGGGGIVDVHDIAPALSGLKWIAGDANASGAEFQGTTSPSPAADWYERQGVIEPWSAIGGDLVLPAATSQVVTSTGATSFFGAGLEASIQNAVDARDPHEGFLLRGPAGGLVPGDVAIQFASSTSPSFGDRPGLVVDFTPPANAGGQLSTGTVTYIGEGENFRWIYDTDGDDLLYTPIGGVCEALEQQIPDGTIAPYNYAYQGAPGYVGTDCCAWQVDAPQTGVVGTGQAIFFHNLDPSNPANLPPDTDGDGMRDGCDNCVNVPNGPYLGTCIGLDGPGASCAADTDCAQYEYCSQSQEDVDLDQTGDACSVPEPGFGTMLGVAAVWLGGISRRRRTNTAPSRPTPARARGLA